MEIINDSQWINGLDSVSYTIGQGSYQWAQNVVNRGGIMETRQGFAEIASVAQKDPRGCAIVTIGSVTWMLAAIDDQIYKLNLNNPAAGLVPITGLSFPTAVNPIPANKRAVHFEICVQAQRSVKEQPSGYRTIQLPAPKFVVIIQDGFTAPQYWDPSAAPAHQAGKIDEHPDFVDTKPNNTPTGLHMQWAGDRLWVAQGRKLRASNLLNPFQFTEEDTGAVTASGGFFFLPDNVNAIGVTHDYKQLLVFTHFTTSAFQVGVEDRSQWSQTQDFQRVVLQSIGCAAHRTVINMYGMTWWMSHEGLVGLDNALAAYQTTRLDVQDLNMMRSKEGVSWNNGGGCSGSFSNFLFFSMPSANKWNQHTWLMDQAPLNTLSGMAPPVWAANWTGIRPEQWVTGQVAGRQRCFCISRDLTDTGHQTTVWEAFIGQRMDVPKVGAVGKAKDIGCAFESRFYGLSPAQYSKLRWVEIDAAEIVGDVRLQVYYCGRRTSYKKIIDTHLTATVAQDTEEVFDPNDAVKVSVPQYRTIRSVTDVHSTTDLDSEVQTPYLRNKDREFSVLVQWSGQMAVSGIRLAVDPEPDYLEGGDMVDEYLRRTITAEGEGGIDCVLPPANAPSGKVTSQYLAPIKPRWVEFPAYDSAVPNGVFFVDELIAVPVPGAYPSNQYPMDITLSSETQGDTIYFTTNGTIPKGPPTPHGHVYPPKPSMLLNQTLKAIGARSGLRDSPMFEGRYTQARVADVVFTPPPAGYPPDEYNPHLAPLDVGMVGAYNFDALVNGKLKDFSDPGGSNGTPYFTTIVTGKHGKAFSFNGTTGYVQLGQAAPFKLTGSSTWMAWVNATADSAGNIDAHIIAKADDTTGWALKTSHSSGAHRFCLQVNGPLINHQSLTIRALNTWYHVAAVYNAENKTMSMVVNGKLDDGVLNGIVPAAMVNSAANTMIGRRAINVAPWTGLIDDLRVFNRALSLDEIKTLMNKPVVVVPPPISDLVVTLSCPTGGADIHWHIEGNVPYEVNETDPLFDPANPIHPYLNDIIHAKAFKQYYLPSHQSGGKYSAEPRCMLPTCTPDGGDYPGDEYDPSKTIHVASGTTGSKLRYTINNDKVVEGTVLDKNPDDVEVKKDDVLRVIAQKKNFSDSLTKTATYTVKMEKVATPVLDPPANVIANKDIHTQSVHITCSTADVTMSYIIAPDTDQHTMPSRTNGTLISGNDTTLVIGPPTHFVGHWLLRVMAFRVDMLDSDIARGNYDHER